MALFFGFPEVARRARGAPGAFPVQILFERSQFAVGAARITVAHDYHRERPRLCAALPRRFGRGNSYFLKIERSGTRKPSPRDDPDIPGNVRPLGRTSCRRRASIVSGTQRKERPKGTISSASRAPYTGPGARRGETAAPRPGCRQNSIALTPPPLNISAPRSTPLHRHRFPRDGVRWRRLRRLHRRGRRGERRRR